MFAQAWRDWADVLETTPLDAKAPRRSLLAAAEVFFDFSVSDLARYQLMNQAVIHGFTPTAEAYAESVRAYERMRADMRGIGVRAAPDIDLWTAMLAGAIDQQLANDPGGTRWRRQLPRLVDMFADEVGITGPPLRRSKK
jgi:hypothetical protein